MGSGVEITGGVTRILIFRHFLVSSYQMLPVLVRVKSHCRFGYEHLSLASSRNQKEHRSRDDAVLPQYVCFGTLILYVLAH